MHTYMKRPEQYQTRQSEAILVYLMSLDKNAQVTAKEIASHFDGTDVCIGRTTIYRHLDKLVNCGKVKKYTAVDEDSACYQYVGEGHSDCNGHLHLKCDECGVLLHANSDCQLGAIARQVLDGHTFHINTSKTVLYGTCENCLAVSGGQLSDAGRIMRDDEK